MASISETPISHPAESSELPMETPKLVRSKPISILPVTYVAMLAKEEARKQKDREYRLANKDRLYAENQIKNQKKRDELLKAQIAQYRYLEEMDLPIPSDLQKIISKSQPSNGRKPTIKIEPDYFFDSVKSIEKLFANFSAKLRSENGDEDVKFVFEQQGNKFMIEVVPE